MNKILNFKRLSSLISKELSENYSKILVLLGISISVSIIGWLFTLFTSSEHGISVLSRTSTIQVIIAVVFFILPYTFYNHLNHRKNGIESTMLPASTLEKYLSMILISVVIIPLSIFVSCVIVVYIIAIVTPDIYPGYLFGNDSTNFLNSQPAFDIISSIFVMSGIALFGNLLFRKNKILKTVLSLFVINMGILILGIILIKNGVNLFEFAGFQKTAVGNGFAITMGKPGMAAFSNLAQWIKIILNIALPVLLYYGTYYRLKHLKF